MDFLHADIRSLVDQLSVDEKVLLLSGKDYWRTHPIPRLGIPSIKMTDGPNGARGERFFKMIPATVLPNATAIAASFSPAIAREAGNLLAEETKARGASVLLGPTVNMARNPLGGRTFESFSEDPTLSGRMAAQYIRGLQENGVSATIKHFLGNDQEHDRMGADCVIQPRPLREIYLRPFQLAQAYSQPLTYMTSYNKVNGTHVSENKALLDVLRKEWGFSGLVVSDWFGTYSVTEAINAGLDLEMPGPPRWRQKALIRQSVNAHKTSWEVVDERLVTLLTWVQTLARMSPEIVFNEAPERTRWEHKDTDAELVRRIGTEGIVLLKNDSVLPIRRGSVAVIGPNAKADVVTGGGSARLRPAWVVTPWEGLEQYKPEQVSLTYTLGCKGAKFLPVFGPEFTATDGKPGFDLLHFAIVDGKQALEPTVVDRWGNSDLILYDFYHPDLGNDYFTEIRATFVAPLTGAWEFEASVTGQGWLFIDDTMVLDISKEQKRTSSFFGNGTEGTIVQIQVEKGKTYRFTFLHDSRAPPKPPGASSTPLEIVGMKLGSFQAIQAEEEMAKAVRIASEAETSVLVVGLNQDWESESYDRPTLDLPLRTNELITKVAAVSKKTVVVIQAGSAVSMPWLDKVDAVVYSWYGGNEAGSAIAQIVYGDVNPSGRLPLSLPRREIDIAARLNSRSTRTRISYDEGIWMGYRHFNARGIAPLFAFGFGLSYTEFEYDQLSVDTTGLAEDWKLHATVRVTNTGATAGSHSVHFYLSPPLPTATSLEHPEFTLQAFDKTRILAPGASETITVEMDKYAISHWDEMSESWRVEPGQWGVSIGRDASSMCVSTSFDIAAMSWRGL
ncbi:hypothetical protein CspeluHIS016_0212160 [Cutaneotrichosporon spelunceum]|uniref:beta-glucosidase n=1 Tax=Cutaneotrichosporon spelunceum TaxID=1672016 RepID=A0AAD3TSQ6_9TREE|nr:hypothetical protein CspeluHIS016_0212160 [Cutaneotrichosporon spelunceum]